LSDLVAFLGIFFLIFEQTSSSSSSSTLISSSEILLSLFLMRLFYIFLSLP
jgi:hypothetical protein